MIAKISVILSMLTISNAMPSYVMRFPGSPNVAFGFGSGFSSDFGGIRQSNSIGSSFQIGDAEAYGAGLGLNGNVAQGIGYAHAAPQQAQPLQHHSPASRPSASHSPVPAFGNSGVSLASAQNNNGFGSAISAVQNSDLRNQQSAVSQAYNGRNGFDSAVSSVKSHGSGFGVAQSAAQNVGGYGSSYALSQNQGLNDFGSAISAASNNGRFGSSFAQSAQQHGRYLEQSGASSVNAPGIQLAQSHAINNGFY